MTGMFRSTISALALALAASPVAAETKLLFSTFFPKAHPFVANVLEPWAADVEAATGGNVDIEFAASSLAPPAEQLDMVQNGVADIAVQFAGVVPNRLGAYQISEIPGEVGSSEAMSVALWRTHEAHLADAFDSKRLRILSAFVFPAQGMYSTDDTPLASLEDVKAAKIATTPGIPATAVGSLTGGVIAGPAFRYFELVSKGMVDAYMTVTPLEVMGFNLSRYTKVATSMGDISTAGSFVLVINEKAWRGLSEEDRAAIESQSGEAFSRRMAALDIAAGAAEEKMKDEGIVFEAISPEFEADLKSAFAFLEDDWNARMEQAGIDGEAAMSMYRETIKQVQAGG